MTVFLCNIFDECDFWPRRVQNSRITPYHLDRGKIPLVSPAQKNYPLVTLSQVPWVVYKELKELLLNQRQFFQTRADFIIRSGVQLLTKA